MVAFVVFIVLPVLRRGDYVAQDIVIEVVVAEETKNPKAE